MVQKSPKTPLRNIKVAPNTECIIFFQDLPQQCFDYHNLTDRKRNHSYKTQASQAWCDSDRKPQRKSDEWKGTIHIFRKQFYREEG